ncbi:MAG TPA: DUF167 domain-containing protein [Amoebophilaceae bacterium]|jgi:hypothetical protein|nr:DUF167 domain-containing protein [Amoebophilaceae bacterium]
MRTEQPATSEVYLLPVRATPNGSKNKIEQWVVLKTSCFLHIRVTAPPEKGKANQAIAALLSKALGIPKSSIQLVQGATSRNKLFKIAPWSNDLAKKLPPPPLLPSLFTA